MIGGPNSPIKRIMLRVFFFLLLSQVGTGRFVSLILRTSPPSLLPCSTISSDFSRERKFRMQNPFLETMAIFCSSPLLAITKSMTSSDPLRLQTHISNDGYFLFRNAAHTSPPYIFYPCKFSSSSLRHQHRICWSVLRIRPLPHHSRYQRFFLSKSEVHIPISYKFAFVLFSHPTLPPMTWRRCFWELHQSPHRGQRLSDLFAHNSQSSLQCHDIAEIGFLPLRSATYFFKVRSFWNSPSSTLMRCYG